MKKVLSISFLVIMAFASAMAQLPQLRTSIKTFPAQISNTNGHTLEVYIHNDGSSTFSGNVTVKMDINGGTTSLGSAGNRTIAPGDSSLYSRYNYNFPQGMVNIGYNDIVVWPTAPNASPVYVAAEIRILYTPEAAFKIFSGSVEGAEDLMRSPEHDHNLRITSQNLGFSPNQETIEFFVQLEDEKEVKIGEVDQIVNPGDSLVLRVMEFEFDDILEDHWCGHENPEYISFFAREKQEDNSLGGPVFSFSPMTGIDENLENMTSVFPNPVSEQLFITLPAGTEGNLQVVSLLGQVMFNGDAMSTRLDVVAWEAGIYFVRLETAEGVTTRKIVKK